MNGTLARRQLRLAAMAVLQALVGIKVESPGDWETVSQDLPEIKLRVGPEQKSSEMRGPVEFTTVATLEILARVEAIDGPAAQDAIEALGGRIENALLAARLFTTLLQQVSSISTQTNITAEAKRHLGEARLSVNCEVFEFFEATLINPDDYPELQRVMITLDTVRPFDAEGIYPAPAIAYEVPPAPRVSGPDGRAESGLDIALT